MRLVLPLLLCAVRLVAQSVGGPVLTHVVDAQSRLRPVFGIPSSAHIGIPSREGVKSALGPLTLLAGGTALRDSRPLDGAWASLVDGAFVSADGRQLLIARSAEPWLLNLPSRAEKIRVSSDGQRVLTILQDEYLTAWTSSGTAAYRIPASIWWSFDFAGQGAMAYDPAANALLSIDASGTLTTLRALPGDGAALQLAVTADASRAVLLDPAARLGLILTLPSGDPTSFTVPETTSDIHALPGGRVFLLSTDPQKPLWLLDPYADAALLVVPAVNEDGGAR